MNDIYSSRKLEQVCRRDVNFMYLFGRAAAPDHATIVRFRSERLTSDYNRSFGDRNSFSKTDRDATFMRMKEDHMKSGQLKPGYNITLGVDAEYIVGAMISQERSDASTFIPMMESLHFLGYTKPVADAGFESEENYTWCEENGQIAFIKPANHDRSKTRKYKSDIGKRENMRYDAENDASICHAGHPIKAAYQKRAKKAWSFMNKKSVSPNVLLIKRHALVVWLIQFAQD